MKYNKKEYKYYVVNINDNLIVSGWEHKEDALDHLDELLEGITTAVTSDYKIYSFNYLQAMKETYLDHIDVNNNDHWEQNINKKQDDLNVVIDIEKETKKRAKLMDQVSKMTHVNMQGHGMFSSRKDIETAQNYFYDILEKTSDSNKVYLGMAFMVFWNTLADNYVVFKKDSESEVK